MLLLVRQLKHPPRRPQLSQANFIGALNLVVRYWVGKIWEREREGMNEGVNPCPLVILIVVDDAAQLKLIGKVAGCDPRLAAASVSLCSYLHQRRRF